jgi:excisionase family DNA binding protein
MTVTNSVSERALLTVPEAAALAGLSKAVAYRLAAEDRLPGLLRLPGRRLMVRRKVLEAWLVGDDVADTLPRSQTDVGRTR